MRRRVGRSDVVRGAMFDDAGPEDEQLRACPRCRRYYEPILFETDQGMRIWFTCLLRGARVVIDPFEDAH
jgi:hypothetical protein